MHIVTDSRSGPPASERSARLDRSEIDPSILDNLFDRELDSDKRCQLRAHYNDCDRIKRIVEPAIVRPLPAE